MTTEQWERENQDTLMEYFIDGDPSVRRIQCEYCRKVIYTQTRNRKYCSFQTCGHKMLNLRKSLKKRAERGTYTCACCGEQFLPIRADARYTCEAMKIFLLGAIKQVFQPGCKFETMLCLVGGQGCGSPVATSKCCKHFEAPTEPTGETGEVQFFPTAGGQGQMVLGRPEAAGR